MFDHDDLRRVGSFGQKFFHRRGSRIAKAADDDMFVKTGLQRSHTVILHVAANDELVGRSQEQEPDGDPCRCHHEGVDESGSRSHRRDVAVAHRADRDHREIHDVAERHLAVVVINQSVAIKPHDGDDDTDEHGDDPQAPQQLSEREQVSGSMKNAGRAWSRGWCWHDAAQ